MDNLEKYEKACRIASQVKSYAESLLKENALVLDIANAIEKKIFELGAKPAFPVNISINEIAAHYVPKYKDTLTLKRGDLVKIDFGVHIDGYPSDTAFSVSIGKNEENEKLIATSKAALEAAVSKIKPGVAVSEIGAAIDAEAKKAKLQVIRNLTGHGLERYDLHAKPTIPNFDDGDKTELKDKSIVAIEPFITNGSGLVEETEVCEVYCLIKDGPIRDKAIIEFIKKEYGSLPFAKRWLVEKFSLLKTNLAIKEAVSRGLLHEFHALREISGAKVAQSEHTILVTTPAKILTK